ncbi:hypothetical protein P261_01109 [Lachnospiraceae bacterium TWA4]|nr:hypothetical protein P261_01109 [Lachnospiraceae bacterium TWA4]
MNENIKKILEANNWELATCANNEPNVVPVGFKVITEDGKLAVGDLLLDTTLTNIKANPKVAISAYDAKTSEGYQVKGSAEYVTEGPLLDACKAMAEEMFKGALSPKGVVVITPEKVIVTTPGPDNKKVL